MIPAFEEFEKQVLFLLDGFAQSVKASNSEFLCTVNQSSNDSFPLRSYVALKRNRDADELALTVDVKKCSAQLILEIDLVWEDGTILVEGPRGVMKLGASCDFLQESVAWLLELKKFLVGIELRAVEAVRGSGT